MIRTTLAAVAIASSLVMASGCAVTRDQQTTAERIARDVEGGKAVKNEVVVRA
jgi:osmotically-inducible protein OsmY